MNHQLVLILDYHIKLPNYQLKLIRKCQFTKLKITGFVGQNVILFSLHSSPGPTLITRRVICFKLRRLEIFGEFH